MRPYRGKFEYICREMRWDLLQASNEVDVGKWHAQSTEGNPLLVTFEKAHVCFEMTIPGTIPALQLEVSPNLPWAEDHFLERVGGEPLNPGNQYLNWPWYKGNVERHQTQDEERFSHTYMERFWPKKAGPMSSRTPVQGDGPRQIWGIRFAYGDLNDLVKLLAEEPLTRQAYLPVWFPEDTGAVHGERVPCTLGYQFLMREGKLDVDYFIRSVDFVRHFRDDVYLAARLCQWMIEMVHGYRVTKEGPKTQRWMPGKLCMWITSLHIMAGDRSKLMREMQEDDRDHQTY